MIVYIPTPIESEEQAAALPTDTIAYLLHDDGYIDALAIRLHRLNDGDPRAWSAMGAAALLTHARMIGWTALVPVEAEEETDMEHTGWTAPFPIRRLVTPWEPAG